MEFKPAQCPSCGGSLQLPDDRKSVNCMYCGATVVVNDAIQAAAAASIPNLLKLATAAAQSRNYQEAYLYYTKALELDGRNSQAWAGKAEAAGFLSSQHSFRIPEMLNYFANSLEAASDENTDLTKQQAATVICKVISEHYRTMRSGLSPAFAEGTTWTFYVNRLGEILKEVDRAHRLIPESAALLKLGIYICDDNSGRLSYVNRNTGQRTARALPTEWQSFVAQMKSAYTETLCCIEPSLRATPLTVGSQTNSQTSSFHNLNPLHVAILGIGALLAFVVLLLLVGLGADDKPMTGSTSNISNDEKMYLEAAGFFFAVQHQQCKSAIEMMASAETGHTSLKEIKIALENAHSKIDTSWQTDYLPVAKKGIPFKFLGLDKRLQDLYKLEQSAFEEMLAYWKDRKTGHISDGSDQLRRAAIESAAIAKELSR